ncbi:hypothetical protein [Nitrospira moscoviensis]|uniref:Outer membrane protein beta-barrel domain-containing protein n=1 Tax=Nitrospira moscoviensis TaxID=42253 RepID=A0A0K2G6S3_NITMO|nr:hypothetical protein [Nitrospira moscoviensis]ALA56648.1 exported protein of unknown function [Nitrospira moscoviensis]
MRRALICAPLLAALLTALPLNEAQAERKWEFSFGAFGGRAYHANTTARFNYAITPAGFEPVDAKAIGLNFDNSDSFGAKLTAWYLPRRLSWQPQIGVELDWTSFTADLQPQTVPGEGVGKMSGLPLGAMTFGSTSEFAVNQLAVNLLFRYPIWATTDMPQGRWYPYVGIGGGVQRARLTESSTGHRETSYSPAFQGLVGAKIFLVKNLAVFGEFKWTQAWHSFNFAGLGLPSDYKERYTIATGHVVGGVALHF